MWKYPIEKPSYTFPPASQQKHRFRLGCERFENCGGVHRKMFGSL